jgi:hypothetical protein
MVHLQLEFTCSIDLFFRQAIWLIGIKAWNHSRPCHPSLTWLYYRPDSRSMNCRCFTKRIVAMRAFSLHWSFGGRQWRTPTCKHLFNPQVHKFQMSQKTQDFTRCPFLPERNERRGATPPHSGIGMIRLFAYHFKGFHLNIAIVLI